MKVSIKLKEIGTGRISEEVSLEDIIFHQNEIEFDFGEDSLPYDDFMFYADEYEVICVVKDMEE